MSSAIYFHEINELTSEFKRQMELALDTYPIKFYDVISDVSVTNVIKIINERKDDIFITIEISDTINDKYNYENGVIFVNSKTDKTFINNFNKDFEFPLGIQEKSMMYTNNESISSFYFVLRSDSISPENYEKFILKFHDLLITKSVIKAMEKLSSGPKTEYTVKDHNQKTIIKTTNKDTAIKLCNNYDNATVYDDCDLFVHRSTKSKINPTKTSSVTDKKQTISNINVNSIKGSTSINKF